MATDGDGQRETGAGYRAAFEASPDAIVVHDSETGAVLDANEAAVDLFGRSRESLRDTTLADLHSDNRSATDLFERAVDTGSAQTEWEIEHPDGTRWVDVTVERVDEDTGHVVTFLRDLTDRRELELDLRRERGVTERVLDTTPTGIVVHDADGEITMANPRAEEILSLETSNLAGQRYDDLPFDIRTVDSDPLASEEFPFARVKSSGEPITGEQVLVETPDGECILSVSGAPLWDDDDFDGAVMSIKDVTSEFETKAQIREQKEHLETVIGNLPVVLFTLDTEGTFTFSEGRGLEYLGLEPGELNGVSVFDAYADNPDIIDTCKRALDGEAVRAIQEVGDRVFETQYRPVTDENDELQEVIGVSLDITEQKQQERQLQTLMETVPAGVFMTSTDGEVEYVNNLVREMVGLGEGEAVGKQMSELLPGNRAAQFEAHNEAALDREEPVEREHTVQGEDGEWTITSTVAPVNYESGEPTAIVGVANDVTERKERKRQLEENDAILTQLTETTDEVFWLFDGDFSEIQFVNDAYEDIWGRSSAALEDDAMDFMKGVHPDDRDIVREAIQKLRNGESSDREYRVDPTTDFQRWVWVRGEPIFDDDGTVERVAGFARDITERKEREQALERSERQFEAVFNDPQLLVGLLDTDGTVRRVNDTALDAAGVDRSEIAGTPFPETPWWSHDDELQADLREWIDRAADGEYVEYEAIHPLPDGGEMAVTGTIRPVTDEDGTVRSLIASARDITERKEHEKQLEESNERLEKFAYVASHDLQEPLRTISNYIELIAEEYGDNLDEEAQQFIDVVVTGSERMQSMINGLLDYSRVTTRGEEFEPVDTETVVDNAVDDLGVLLDEHDSSVDWGELPTVDADRHQLRQVVQNLVKNALEHSGEQSVEIRMRGTEEADRYHFEIEDDGPGIAQNRQEKIFRIFKSGKQYQTSSQAKGIGLAICDNIVQRHGGEIWVESDPGDGSTFHFTITKQ